MDSYDEYFKNEKFVTKKDIEELKEKFNKEDSNKKKMMNRGSNNFNKVLLNIV